ncbi:Oxidative stress-induced growth inhibitor 2, partial [Actinomortierella ambigua]
MIMSLLLSGYEPYFHSPAAPTPHPDPILQRALAPSDIAGAHPRSLLDQNLPALAAHIYHQLAEAGRDANPVGAMFDSLAHPNIDTQRGEHPSYLAWTTPQAAVQSKQSKRSARRDHIVLGRGDIGGIWADMDHDHTQTLSYSESMELPVYSFADFLAEHPGEYDATLERPVRATVSAYYKEYAEKTGISEHIWTNSTVSDVFHLKDLENHCCCYLDPSLTPQEQDDCASDDADHWPNSSGPSAQVPCQKCSPFRYAILGYRQRIFAVDETAIEGAINRQKSKQRRRQYFLLRCKTLALATGTFDQPRKLPLNIIRPKPTISTIPDVPNLPLAVQPAKALSALPPVTPMFYDTRSIDEWITETTLIPRSSDQDSSETMLPIVVVGTGLSAADAILLIRERDPCRPIIHLYRYATASEPSPLKRCHKEVYPEYASIWTLMKKCATKSRRTGTTSASVIAPAPGSYYRSCCEHSNAKSKEPCDCQKVVVEPSLGTASERPLPPSCLACMYNGLADATLSGWDPSSGQVEIILNSGLRVQHRVAAIGVFIGKQVNLSFLKGSLALDYLQAPPDSSLLSIPTSAPYRNVVPKQRASSLQQQQFGHHDFLDSRVQESQQLLKQGFLDLAADIPTPPRTPPFLPIAGEDMSNESDVADDDDSLEPKEDLTGLKPLVTDMWSLRLVVAPRVARAFRPSLAQRVSTPRLTPTSLSTPSSPTLPAVFPHNVPEADSPHMSPTDHSDTPALLMKDTAPEGDGLLQLSPLPSPVKEEASAADDGGENRYPFSTPVSSAWGTMTCSIQRASRVLRQSLSYGVPHSPVVVGSSTNQLGQSCRSPSTHHSTSDLQDYGDRPDHDRGGAATQHHHCRPAGKDRDFGTERRTAQQQQQQSRIDLPSSSSYLSCFSMPCSPVLSCVDRLSSGLGSSNISSGEQQQQRRQSWLLPIPSFLSIGRSSSSSSSSSSVAATYSSTMPSVPTSAIATVDSTPKADDASRGSGPTQGQGSYIQKEDAESYTKEVILDEQEDMSLVVVATATAAAAADVTATAAASDEWVGSQCCNVSTVGHDCGPATGSGCADGLLPSLLRPSTKAVVQPPPTSPLPPPPPPLMDQSIYAVGAVTGSKFVRFILGHCVAAVSDM